MTSYLYELQFYHTFDFSKFLYLSTAASYSDKCDFMPVKTLHLTNMTSYHNWEFIFVICNFMQPQLRIYISFATSCRTVKCFMSRKCSFISQKILYISHLSHKNECISQMQLHIPQMRLYISELQVHIAQSQIHNSIVIPYITTLTSVSYQLWLYIAQYIYIVISALFLIILSSINNFFYHNVLLSFYVYHIIVCFIFYSEREAGFHIEHTVLTTNLFETGCLYAGSLKLRAGIICCSG